MKLKGYTDITFDEFPKLYESSRKVLITHLYQAENHLKTPPKKFCKMYTTRLLADQLSCYLSFRKMPVNENDFVIVEPFKPFILRMANCLKLQVMFCTATELGNSYLVLLRKGEGQPVLYAYSSVNQAAPEIFIRNETFNKWGRLGFEELILNLDLMHLPFSNIDFYKLGEMMTNLPNRVRIKVPIFGYEYVVSEMAFHWRQCVALSELLFSCYKLLPQVNISHLADRDTKPRVFIYSSYDFISSTDTNEELPVSILEWTPEPRRNNLQFLCSLIRPKKITSTGSNYTGSKDLSYLKDFLRK